MHLFFFSSICSKLEAVVTQSACQKFPKCCRVFSRLGRWSLCNNFLQGPIVKHCGCRHTSTDISWGGGELTHTHTHTHTHFLKYEALSMDGIALFKEKTENKRRRTPPLSFQPWPSATNHKTWLSEETTHRHEHSRNKQQCFMYTNTRTHKLCTNPTITNIRSIALTCSFSTHSCHPREPKRTYRSQSARTHTHKLYIHSSRTRIPHIQLIKPANMNQHWRRTSARLHTSQRKHTSEDISSFLYVPPNKSGPHCGGFAVHSQHLGQPAFTHTPYLKHCGGHPVSVCVCVRVCVVPLFHSLGFFSVRLVLFFFFCFVLFFF